MSGILAIMSLDGRPVPPELPRAQLAAIAHRGEWEPRLWEAPGIALGHVNLPRTPEAEREFLPMSDGSGRYWLTWDGRLDNREELGPKLGYDATERRGNTDADYVLDSFIKWGDECVHQLLGDWAVVIWDSEKRRLFCAKDPLGWRQLYYAEHDGLLAVASEPQQFFANNWLPKVANEDYVLRLLADMVQEPGDSCYAGIAELWGGKRLFAAEGRLRVSTYWRSPRVRRLGLKDPAEYVEQFIDLFGNAVRPRLRSNRPIGVFLSGGIDSSYIAAIAGKRHPGLIALTAYAAGTKWMDERAHAAIVASHLGLRHELVEISDCQSLSRTWLCDASFDQPNQPPQGALHVRLAAFARDMGAGVVLGGEGADEWMTGTPSIGRDLVTGRLRSAGRQLRLSKGGATRTLARTLWAEFLPARSRRAIRKIGNGRAPYPPFITQPPHGRLATEQIPLWRPGARRRHAWQVYRSYAGPVVNWRDRHAFGRHGVELRTPFNDLRVVEFMASTPEHMKQFRGRRKDVLREAEYPVLPASIPDRDDFGLYTELVDDGVGAVECERVEEAIRAFPCMRGIASEVAEAEVRLWAETHHRWWEPNWRTVTSGLWLAHSGVRHSGVIDDSNVMPMKFSGEEVIT